MPQLVSSCKCQSMHPGQIDLLSPHFHSNLALIARFFGTRLLKEAYDMYKSGSTGPSEELEETEAELNKKEETDPESGDGQVLSTSNIKVMTSAFTITFLAEW